MAHGEKDIWDKTGAIGTLLSGLLIPIAVAVIGGRINDSIKSSENQLKYIEIATSLIRDEPKEENEALRAWAIDVLAANSKEVPLGQAARDELKKRKTPIFGSGTMGSWNTTYDAKSGLPAGGPGSGNGTPESPHVR